MKTLSWLSSATPALNIQTKPNKHENIGRKKIMATNRQHFAPNQIATSSQDITDSRHNARADSNGKWGDDFKPESPPPHARIHLSESCFPSSGKQDEDEACHAGTSNMKTNKEASETGVQMDFDMSDENLTKSKSHSSNSSTSTLFQDPQHDITILLTAPKDECPELTPSETSSPSSRSSSDTSSPPVSVHQSPPTTTLLKPPIDSQRELRKQQHLEEIRDVRKWLITFINAKGDTFPREVRHRMMEEYQICEWDLAPEVVAKFNAAEEHIDRVDIHGADEVDQKESLQILSQAFQSQIEEVTPKRLGHTALPITRSRRNSRPVMPRTISTLVTIPDDEELSSSTWLCPSTKPTIDSHRPVMPERRYVRKTLSTPELHVSSRPQCQTRNSASALRADSKLELERTRKQKSRGFKVAFGSLIESFGGDSSGVKSLKNRVHRHSISSHG